MCVCVELTRLKDSLMPGNAHNNEPSTLIDSQETRYSNTTDYF